MDLLSRIWDNFLLDGEIFAIKTGLAMLKYRENQLINQPYNMIINYLRGKDLIAFVDEDKFFKVLETIEIDKDEYYDDLKL